MFHKRLRFSRMKMKYTQQKMADILEISLNAYQKYEQAEREPSLATLVKIADTLDVSIDFLLCRDNFLTSYGVPFDECP